MIAILSNSVVRILRHVDIINFAFDALIIAFGAFVIYVIGCALSNGVVNLIKVPNPLALKRFRSRPN